MHLLSPLARSQFKPLPDAFPKLFNFLNVRVKELANSIGESGNLYMEKVAVLNNLGDRFVLVTVHVSGKLVVYKSGDEKWRLIDDLPSPSPYDDVILWKEKFYAVDYMSKIVLVNTADLNVSTIANSIFGGDKKLWIRKGSCC
ncbi:hypothetical protein ACS0TY_020981 [Phlomoides rotata]